MINGADNQLKSLFTYHDGLRVSALDGPSHDKLNPKTCVLESTQLTSLKLNFSNPSSIKISGYSELRAASNPNSQEYISASVITCSFEHPFKVNEITLLLPKIAQGTSCKKPLIPQPFLAMGKKAG